MVENVIIMGAAGRDFHNFNVYFRDNKRYNVVCFTATQIPNIDGRCYPASLAGSLYPNGIPIEFSHNVEGIDIRKSPQMADLEPSEITREGPEPQTGHWPPIAAATPKGDRRTYPGAGSEYFHGKK